MTNSLLSPTVRPARPGSDRPFVRLVRLFVGRMFHGSSDSGEGELSLSTGVLLSYLPLPGGVYAIFLLQKYSTLSEFLRGRPGSDPLRSALPDEYFFIVLSMVVTGVVAVWRWDSIFPDKRDFTNLVPLPVSTAKIFFANLAAVLSMAVILALDVNAGSGLLFPLAVGAYVDSFGFFLHFLWVHICVVVLASVFTFFAVFLIAGLVMTAFPAQVFRRASLYLRAVLVGGFVAMLATSFAVPARIADLPNSLVRCLPSVWFLGLCQVLRVRASASLEALGRLALIDTIAVIAAGVVIYVLGYRKCFMQIPESVELLPTVRSRAPLFDGLFRAMDRTFLKTPFQRAGYRFVVRTLFRSEDHSLILGGFLGLGVVIASQVLFASFTTQGDALQTLPSPEVLMVPLVLIYCIMLGVRFAFEFPADLRSNWIFRLNAPRDGNECRLLGSKVLLSFVVPWAFAAVFPVYTFVWGLWVGILHTVVITLWSVLLADMLLVKFRKIPFTCPFPEFRNAGAIVVIWYVLGFVAFGVFTAQLEYWALLHSGVLLVLPGVAAAVWYLLRRLRRNIQDVDKELVFESATEEGFELLNLQRGV